MAKAHVAQWKKDEVTRLTKILVDTPVLGVAQIGGIPAAQMQEMRKSLRAHVKVIGAKNRLLKIALTEASKERPALSGLSDKVGGQVAILATDLNPFRLYKTIRQGATMAPLKAGQTSPADVNVKKGPTPFGPGPIVGELQRVGIPAKIEGPKVVIQKDVTPVKKGDVVSADLANMLAKLEIKPVELAIRLEAAFESDTIFLPNVLAIDEDAIKAELGLAARVANELAMQVAWATPKTAGPLVTRAFKIAAALGIESGADLGEAQDQAAAAYAAVLAGLGKKPDDLPEKVRERLGKHVEKLTAVAAAPAAPAKEAKEEAPKEEEKGVSEEEAAAGLGALFG